MQTFVLGATGSIGGNIVHALVQQGHDVRVLVRPTSNTRGIDDLPQVERVTGDLTDAASLRAALAGTEILFHAASHTPSLSIRPGPDVAYAVRGARAVFEAAESARVARLVFTSSLSTIGRPGEPGASADESCPYHLAHVRSAYFQCKRAVEQEALAAAARGLPVVIVNPTGCIGAYDVEPTTSRVVLDVALQRLPAILDGPTNMVPTASVAAGHLLAAERGVLGERYILGGENLTMRELFDRVAAVVNRPAPARVTPLPVARVAGYVSEYVAAYVTHGLPKFPLKSIDAIRFGQHYSHAKAAAALGYTPAPLEEGIRAAFTWYRANGYLDPA